MTEEKSSKITIVMPVFNDWESLEMLIANIRREVRSLGNVEFDFVIVDDCSDVSPDISVFKGLEGIRLLRLYRNMGHQRAIAVGLCYAEDHLDPDGVVVMDADGEDRPLDLIPMIKAMREKEVIVFAGRRKRRETFPFRFFYFMYKLIFRILTSKEVSFGNFSVIPGKQLKRIVNNPDIWSHYASAIIRSNLPYTTIKLDRGKRYTGRSQMNLASLIVHGFSSFSIFSDVIAARIVLLTVGLIGINLVISVVVLYRKFVSDMASPGWASTVIIGLAVITGISLIFSLLFGLLVLNTRNHSLHIPSKHYQEFIENVMR